MNLMRQIHMLIFYFILISISKYLFQEGVCFAEKDFNLAKHPAIDVPNLQVIKLMQSFKSKEYVKETFAWMYYYWFLTNDGIEFLRTFLNLPSDIVPATLKKSAKPLGHPMGSSPPGDRPSGPPGDRPRFGDRVVREDLLGNLVVRRVELQLSTSLLLTGDTPDVQVQGDHGSFLDGNQTGT